jgi:hypothetical protein
MKVGHGNRVPVAEVGQRSGIGDFGEVVVMGGSPLIIDKCGIGNVETNDVLGV